jgi:hypothetical protein
MLSGTRASGRRESEMNLWHVILPVISSAQLFTTALIFHRKRAVFCSLCFFHCYVIIAFFFIQAYNVTRKQAKKIVDS